MIFTMRKLAVSNRSMGLAVALACGMVAQGAFAAAVVPPPAKTAPMLAPDQAYQIHAQAGAGLEIPAPTLPDLSAYTAAAVQTKLLRKPGGTASLKPMLGAPMLTEFIGGKDRLEEWAIRQRRMPEAIFIHGGYVTPADLAQQLPKEAFVQTSPGVYLLRLPLVIEQGAILNIDKNTKEFRLSQEQGAFIVNDGKLFVTDTQVTAWRERENGPATFRRAGEFRPFLNAWGGTQTYIVNSKFTSFGYSATKSYGISLSQYSPSMHEQMNRARPTGWIIDSEFVDMWYGFYCYEADDVVVLRNRYRDNQVYGIDPHDRSRRLIISENQTWGTHKKHGIIVSREVNDSWIFNNRSWDNHLSGIVLDRSSVNNVVAYNEVYRNHSDGITVYESDDNLLYGNRAINNDRHGIRVRNSQRTRLNENLLISNRLTGVYGHVKDLRDTPRDLRLDPFDPHLSMSVVGGQIVHNGSSPIFVLSPNELQLYKVNMLEPSKALGLSFSGLLGQFQPQIIDILLRQQQAVSIEPSQPLARKE